MANFYKVNTETGIDIDSISVTTQPTTTSYMQGDTFDPTGIVVTASASGMTGDVTSQCAFSPSVLATPGTQTITVSYLEYTTTLTVSVSEVSISITTPPTTTQFDKGDTLDLSGIVVTAMDGQRTKNVTSECTFSPANGATLDTAGNVTVTATYYGHTASTTIDVIGLLGIEVTTPPTKTIYVENDTLDLTGIVVTADYGAYTMDVTSLCIFRPANGSTVTSSTSVITISFNDQTTTTNVACIGATLDATSWDAIQEVGKQGLGSQFWSVGDEKTLPAMSGSVGSNLNFSNYGTNSSVFRVYIIHFNYRNQNGVYFGCFRCLRSSTYYYVALSDGSFNTSVTSGSTVFNICHNGNYGYGGWKGCDLRYNILGSTNVAPSGSSSSSSRIGYDATSTCATDPVNNTLMAKLPAELRAVMAPIEIYTDNSSDGTHNTSATVTSSIDYLPLMSEYEVIGKTSKANSYEKNYQQRFSFYASGAKGYRRIKNDGTLTPDNSFRLSRSPYSSNNTQWLHIAAAGTDVSYKNISIAGSLTPFFRVA